MWGERVQSLVREDSTCLRPVNRNFWSPCPRVCSLQKEKPSHGNESPCTTTKSRPLWLQLEKACVQQWRLSRAKSFRKKEGKGSKERKKERKEGRKVGRKEGRREEKEPLRFQYLTLSSCFLGSLQPKMKQFRVLHVKVVLWPWTFYWIPKPEISYFYTWDN